MRMPANILSEKIYNQPLLNSKHLDYYNRPFRRPTVSSFSARTPTNNTVTDYTNCFFGLRARNRQRCLNYENWYRPDIKIHVFIQRAGCLLECVRKFKKTPEYKISRKSLQLEENWSLWKGGHNTNVNQKVKAIFKLRGNQDREELAHCAVLTMPVEEFSHLQYSAQPSVEWQQPGRKRGRSFARWLHRRTTWRSAVSLGRRSETCGNSPSYVGSVWTEHHEPTKGLWVGGTVSIVSNTCYW